MASSVSPVWLGKPDPNTYEAPTPAPTCFRDTVKAQDVIDLQNIERVRAGLNVLTVNPLLTVTSTYKAQSMIDDHYWSHTSPDGTTFDFWFRLAKYPYTYAGENLSEGYKDPFKLVQGLMNSPEHRANILNPNFTEIGVTVACGTTDSETTLVVSEYGSR